MLAESALTALFTVVVIDLVLAGDNAVVVGMAAAGLPAELRKKAIVIGIAAAAALRIVFAIFTTQLLEVIGLVLAGGLLLLWVVWKLWRETRKAARDREARHGPHGDPQGDPHGEPPGADALDRGMNGGHYGQALPALAGGGALAGKTFGAALLQIVVADVSMSLDNVLAVAGTARHHVWVLVVGLTLSVALMGVAATVVARLLTRYPWISYLGLGLIAWVALVMIWEGGWDVFNVAHHAGVL